MPAISIIVPIYNAEQYLKECIDSIIAQTFMDFELILVNDGSTDNCGRICDEYASKDKRIKVIHKENGGVSDARNKGLEISEGDYIGFVDSDDWIENNMYEILYKLCLDTKSDISICRIKRGFGPCEGEDIHIFDGLIVIKNLYNGQLPDFSVCNKLFSKKVLENIKFPKNRRYEDAAILYLVYHKAKSIAYINKPLYRYIDRGASFTRSEFSDRRFDIIPNYYETYNFMKLNYPEVSEMVNNIFLTTLSVMVVDIVREKNVLRKYKYISKISLEVRKNFEVIFANNLISVKRKFTAIILGWCPLLALSYYKIRFIQGKIK